MTPATASQLKATRFKMMMNLTSRLLAPLTTSAINWRTWNKTQESRIWTTDHQISIKITDLIELATRPKSSLWGPRRQGIPFIRAAARGSGVQLSLVLHERLIFSLTSLHRWATNQNQLHQAIQKLTKHKTTDNGHCLPPITFAVQKPLPKIWSNCNSGHHKAGRVFQDFPGNLAELVSKVETAHILQCYSSPGPGKELFLLNWKQPRLIGKVESLPLLNQR